MTNPRRYRAIGLFPGLRPKHPKPPPLKQTDNGWRIRRTLREIERGELDGTSTCLPCRRRLDRSQTNSRQSPKSGRILPPECCETCGRWPIDQALIDKGHLGVQSDPRWAAQRMKLADMRTTFAPGEKIMPSRREVANG